MSEKKFSENQIVVSLKAYLVLENYSIFQEVPSMGQSVDIVAKKGRWLTFIEAKAYDWQRALEQCKSHENVADYICIAIASKKISDNLYNMASYKGYGLLHYCKVDDKCTLVLKPRHNKKLWEPQRKVLNHKIKTLKQNDHTTLDDIWNIR